MLNEIDLIARARRGDGQALATLYEQYAPLLYRLAFGLLGNQQDAEEVVQDALTYALKHLQDYDSKRAAFTTWLHTITVSRCRNKRRRRWLPTIRLSDWLAGGGQIQDTSANPEVCVLTDEKSLQIWEAVQQLGLKTREVVVLRYWGGYTIPQIAHIVGCKTPTAQSRLRLAHEQLRRFLGPTLPQWDMVEEMG